MKKALRPGYRLAIALILRGYLTKAFHTAIELSTTLSAMLCQRPAEATVDYGRNEIFEYVENCATEKPRRMKRDG